VLFLLLASRRALCGQRRLAC